MASQTLSLLSFALFCFFIASLHAVSLPSGSSQVVPSGSYIAVSTDHLIIIHPDGSSYSKEFSSQRNAPANNKRFDGSTYGWSSLLNADGQFTYYSSQYDVPPYPTNAQDQVIYIQTTIWDVAATNYFQTVLTYGDGISGWHLEAWFFPLYSDLIKSTPFVVQPGDHVTAEVFLNTTSNIWTANGYVNGVLKTQLQVAYVTDVYIHFPERSDDYVIATSTDTAAQSFLAYVPYDATKTVGRKFTLTGDGYIRLSSNPNLVLDVNGGSASEGARVLVYPKKTPVSQNQQWYIHFGSIYSKLSSGQYALAVTSDNKVVISTAPRYQPLQLNYNGPTGSGITGTAEFSIAVSGIDSCDKFPPSNSFQAHDIVLKKGTQTVASPAWYNYGDVPTGPCDLTFSNTATTLSVSWDSTVIA